MSLRARFVLVLLLGTCLFVSGSAQAQEAWERIALLGLDTRVLAAGSSSDVIFAGTSLGVWRSFDLGTTWEQSLSDPALAHTVVTDLVVTSNGTVFVVTEDGFVFRSTDATTFPGGFTFQKIKGQSQEKSKGTSLAVDPRYDGTATYDTLFMGTLGEGMFYSTNAADADPATVAWTSDTSKPILHIYDLAPGLSGGTLVIYVGGTGNIDGPVFRRNSGGSYSNISAGIGLGGSSEVVTCLLPLPGTPTDTLWAGTLNHGLYKTTAATGTGGFTASCDGIDCTAGCSGTVPRIHSLARSTGTPTYFLEGRDDGPRWSSDDGATCADLPFRGVVQAVAFQRSYNGTNKCYIFFGTPGGLFRKVQGSCTTATSKRGPEIVDGYAVALAGDGAGKFMGSLSGGLFKSVATGIQPGNMVRYNNFPNKKTPQIVAVCLPSQYNETYGLTGDGCGTHNELMVFVAANFPDAPGDNGVYRSTDWGNTWQKLIGAPPNDQWPTGPVWMYDLAITPNFTVSAGKTTLFAGTSRGLYRWDGDSVGWQEKWVPNPVYAVGLPPNYDYGTSFATVFWSTDNGTVNQVYKSNDSGNTPVLTTLSTYVTAPGRVTGFAFPRNYSYASSDVYVSATTSPSTPTGVTGGIYRYYWNSTYWRWARKTPTIAGATYAWDVAAEPDFQNSSTTPLPQDLYLATDGGLLKSTDASSTWNVKDSRPAFSIVYEKTDFSGNTSMVGLQGRTGYAPNDYGAAIQDSEAGSFQDFWGYHFLPDDVWASVAHERDPDIVFSSSPSMGVFVSEDKGLSFRPWNRGRSDQGPCVVRTGLGINMLAARRTSTQDVVWVGTDGDGIKARTTFYNTTTGQVDLDTEDGSTRSSWRHATWTTGGNITGRWERIEVTPNMACNYPAWATSPAQGMASLQGDLAVCEYYRWKLQNSGLTSLAAMGIRQGYKPLQSGVPLSGESVPYHQWNYYQVQVPVGTQDLQVAMDDLDDGGALDPDLYLRHGAMPGLSAGQYDYRPYINGDETVCVRPTSVRLNEGFNAIFSEDFALGIPGTWTVVHGGSGTPPTNNTWVAGNNTTPCTVSPDLPAPFVAPWAIVDGNCAGNGATQDEHLITPTLNLSGYSAIFLTFTNQFRWVTGYGNDVADVDVSTDGGTSWTNILRMTGADDGYPTPNTKRLDLTAYAAGKSSVKVRFHYTGAYDYWWAVDNVSVTGLPSGWNIRHEGSVAPPAGSWTTANPCGRSLASPISAPFLIADASCATAGSTFYEVLLTAPVDCSAYSKVTATVDYALNAVSGVEGRFFVSPDGGYNLTQYPNFANNTTPTTTTVDISSTAAGKSAVVLRFYYRDTGTTAGGWWALDNIRITGEGPKPGTWYVGVYGYAGTNSPYNLTATLNTACTATPPGFSTGGPKREERAEEGTPESVPNPEAPSTSASWGTVSGSGVYQGSGSASAVPGNMTVTWIQRNGTTAPLTNLYANTVVQLSDLTLITGCDGGVFYSPAPDEGQTTWINATGNVASAASNDFRDLLVCSNGDVLIAANGTGAGTAAGGVWLSGDKGAHWMRLSQGFDSSSQELTDLMADSGTPPSYYSSTGGTGEYTRTITADPYPTVSSVTPSTGSVSGGTTVTIVGTGFLGTCPTGTATDCPTPNDTPVVLFGETQVTPATWTATSITCTTPSASAGATKVTVRNPDTRRSSTGPTFTYTCAAPSPVGTLTAADNSAYDFTNVLVSWTAPGNWGDATSGTRSYHFFRDGYNVTTYPTTTLSRTEILTPKVTPHTYFVRQNNGCGQSADTASASVGDDAEAGAYGDSSRDLKWTSKTQLDWGNVSNAATYRVYRGSQSVLANIDDPGGATVCMAYEGATSATGALLSATPASGQFYWYLATALAGTAEGTLGTGTGGRARKVSSSGTCLSP